MACSFKESLGISLGGLSRIGRPNSNSAGKVSGRSSGVTKKRRVRDFNFDFDFVMFHFRRANLTHSTWLSINRTGIVKGGCNVCKACLSRELLEGS